MKKLVLTLILLCLLFSPVSCFRDECDDGGDSWCSKNIRNYCDDSDGWPGLTFSGNSLEKYDCSKFETTCMEFSESRAECVLSKEPCPAGVDSVCVDNRMGDCFLNPYPVYYPIDLNVESFDLPHCDSELSMPPYCVEITSEPHAVCAYWPENCEERESRCNFEFPASVFHCSNQAWTYKKDCPADAGGCVQISETVAECQ